MDFKITPHSETDVRLCDFIMGLDRFDTAQRSAESGTEADPILSFVLPQREIKRLKNLPEDAPYDGTPFDSYEALLQENNDLLALPNVAACRGTTALLQTFRAYIHHRIAPDAMTPVERQFATAHMNIKRVDESLIMDKIAAFSAATKRLCGKDYQTATKLDLRRKEIPEQSAPAFILNLLKQGRAKIEALAEQRVDFIPDLQTGAYDGQWKAWIGGEDDRFTIRFNTRVSPAFHDSELTNTATHELCGHALQFAFLRAAILEKKQPLFAGLNTMIDPGFVQAEGLAEAAPVYLIRTIPNFPATDIRPYAEIWLERLLILRLVMNNAAWLVQNESADAAQVYAQTRVPDETRRWASAWIDLLQDPLYCSYQGSYGAGQHLFRTALETLPQKQFETILKRCYTEILWPEEINAMMREAGVSDTVLFDTTPPESGKAAPVSGISVPALKV